MILGLYLLVSMDLALFVSVRLRSLCDGNPLRLHSYLKSQVIVSESGSGFEQTQYPALQAVR